MIKCDVFHIKHVSKSALLSWITAERYVLLDIVVRLQVYYFGFLITLRKLKTSKINLKI